MRIAVNKKPLKGINKLVNADLTPRHNKSRLKSGKVLANLNPGRVETVLDIIKPGVIDFLVIGGRHYGSSISLGTTKFKITVDGIVKFDGDIIIGVGIGVFVIGHIFSFEDSLNNRHDHIITSPYKFRSLKIEVDTTDSNNKAAQIFGNVEMA